MPGQDVRYLLTIADFPVVSCVSGSRLFIPNYKLSRFCALINQPINHWTPTVGEGNPCDFLHLRRVFSPCKVN